MHCNKFLTPSTVRTDGNLSPLWEAVERGLIPGMTRPADEARARGSVAPQAARAALALYLGFRFLQLIDWVFTADDVTSCTSWALVPWSAEASTKFA